MKRARQKSKNARKARNTEKPRKKLRPAAALKAALITLGVVVVCVFVALGIGFVDESDLLAPIDRESGKINALILGVDDDGLRTDTIMVASFDLDTAEINMLSIPRDSKMYVVNRQLTRKINEIHAMSKKDGSGAIMGPIGSAEAVTQLTGIPINYYIEFSFEAVRNLFETLGPITYDVPDVEGGGKGMNYEDPVQNLYIHLKPGVQELDADQLLQLMRYRKGDSDFARMERQQNVIKAVVEQKLNLSLIMKLPKLFSQLKNDISTNMSSGDVAKYAQYLGELSTEKIHSYQFPGEDKHLSAGWYFICDLEAAKTLITETFGYDASGITTDVEIYGEGSQAKAITNKKKTATGTPSATKAPATTKTPTATKTPASTKTPAVTKAPSATKAPESTKAPATASPPQKTSEPTAVSTPKPTEPPHTSAPTPTKAPEPGNQDDEVISLD